VAAEDLDNTYGKDSFSVLIAVGYTRMNCIRSTIHRECKEAGMRIASFISKSANIDSDVIGEGCIILPNCYVGPGCRIGACTIITSGAILSHDCQVGDYNYISCAAVFGGFSEVTHHCFVGLNSTIRDGIKLAPYTLVGSAANILKSTEEYGIYTGNPARLVNSKKSTDAHI
jgi:sugar O-acyltransferase (sialic acid O-acetyltransferase NeuD family)